MVELRNSEPNDARQRIAALEAELYALREETDPLRIKGQRFDLFMSVSNEGMYDWNVVSGDIHFDPGYYAMAGYRPYEFPGTYEQWACRVHPDDFERISVAVRRYLSGDSAKYDQEFRFRRKNDRWMWIRARARIVERAPDGSALRVIGTHSDVTERRHAENQRASAEANLRQARKMEAVGQLASGISHDFNNILCAIMGNCDLALGCIDDNDPVAAFITDIATCATRSAGLTRQLLTFSRKQGLDLEVVDLKHLVERALPMLMRLLGEDVHLRLECSSPLPTLHLDTGKIEQVLMNLVLNARDAMPKGGEIVIGLGPTSPAALGALPHGNTKPRHNRYAALTVSDTGVGMDETTCGRVFEPFFTTKTAGKGTGLGLATAFGIAEQHSGYLEVRSKPGRGSVFTLHLPIDDASLEKPVSSSTDDEHAAVTGTVLLVENDDLVRGSTAAILNRLGYTVLAAESGSQGLAIADNYSGTIDLVIAEKVMPPMNGDELAKRLRAKRPALVGLVTSDYSDNLIAREGLRFDDLHFIAKPYSMRALAQRIRDLLDPKDNRSKARDTAGRSPQPTIAGSRSTPTGQ